MRKSQGFWIGDIRAEPGLNRIRRGGEEVRLTPKAMRVLECLAKREGDVVSRLELLDEVWPDSIVNEEVLTRAIADLRKAMGERASRPRYIETIPKRGYRLLAEVRAGDPSPNSSGEPSAKRALADRGLWPWAAVIVLALAAAATLRMGDSPAPADARPLRARPVTSLPGRELRPAFSPDGNRFAFAWRESGGDDWDIYVQMADSESRLRLTDDPATDFAPVFAADGRSLFFMRFTSAGCAIHQVPALGGADKKVASCGRNAAADLAASPDGRWLAYSDKASAQESYSIRLLSPESGETRRLPAPGGQHWGDKDPSFSHDGRHVAFTRSVSMATQDLFAVSLQEGGIERLTHDAAAIQGHAWTPEGDILLASSRGGFPALWRLSRPEGALQWLALNVSDPGFPAVSPDGGRILLESRRYQADIHRLGLDGEAAAEPQPAIASTRDDIHLAVSPSGSRLAFVSDRSGSYELWIRQRGKELKATSFNGPFVSHPRFSPDGRRIVFDARPEGHADLFALAAEGGRPQRLTSGESNELSPSFSADGRWIYFGSNRTGRWQIWKMPSQGGEAVQVTLEGGYEGYESTDGRWVYYSKYDQRGLFRRPVEGGQEEPVAGIDPGLAWGMATLSGTRLYLFERLAESTALLLLDPESGEAEPVVEMPGRGARQPVLSPDRKTLYFTQGGSAEADLVEARW